MRLRMLWLLGGILAAAHAASAAYIVTDVGPDEGWPGGVYALNNRGQIAGASGGRAWIRNPDGTKTFIDPLPGFNATIAMGISDNGTVAGRLGIRPLASHPPPTPQHAFLYRNGKLTDLGILPGEREPGQSGRSWAAGVNDAGDVVGTADSPSGRVQPFLWKHGVMRDLGGHGGAALAVNEAGDVVGMTSTVGPTSEQVPFLWHHGKMTILPTLGPGFEHAATAINAAGFIAGHSATKDGTDHACLWANGKATDLGALGRGRASGANSINAHGVIVGESTLNAATRTYPNPTHAVLWKSGRITDLNDLLPPGSGWELTHAVAINDRGEILARGHRDGQYRAVLLKPTTRKSAAQAAPGTTSHGHS